MDTEFCGQRLMTEGLRLVPRDGIKPQMVMIIEIFVIQRQAMKALTDQFLNGMFDMTLVTACQSNAR
jgi:hypothetical protein